MASAAENIREALASALKGVTGVAQTSAWYTPGNFQTPCLVVLGSGPINYGITYSRGTDTLSFTVRGIVGTVDSVGSQKMISQWVGGAVRNAIHSNTALGELIDDLRVTGYSGDQYANISGVDYVYGDWTVDIIYSP